MKSNSLSSTAGIDSNQKNLSPEEKAVLEGAGTGMLRDIFTRIWRVKLRLQFTGWLQYIPFALSALAFFLIAAFTHLFGFTRMADVFGFIGTLLLAILVFDLLTVKFRIRFRERLPKRNDDLGRSLQKIVIDATRMGLGTCWIGPGADQTSVACHLGDRFNPKVDHIICVCAIGCSEFGVRIGNWGVRPWGFMGTWLCCQINRAAFKINKLARKYQGTT
jgi:MFS family permease